MRTVTTTELAVHVLQQAAEAEGAWLRVITPADATTVAVLLSHADVVQAADHAYVEELRQWTHRGPTGDGVPPSALPVTAPAKRGSDYRLRDFVADRIPADPSAGDPVDPGAADLRARPTRAPADAAAPRLWQCWQSDTAAHS